MTDSSPAQVSRGETRTPSMFRRFLFAAAIALAFTASSRAADLVIRSVQVTPGALPDEADRTAHPRTFATALADPDGDYTGTAGLLQFYPVGGTIGEELYVPYFVDLDP